MNNQTVEEKQQHIPNQNWFFFKRKIETGVEEEERQTGTWPWKDEFEDEIKEESEATRLHISLRLLYSLAPPLNTISLVSKICPVPMGNLARMAWFPLWVRHYVEQVSRSHVFCP